MPTCVFDTETRMLADEVEQQYAAELAGESPWSRPDLFGFACGCIMAPETGEALRYGPDEAGEMIERLSEATVTAGYNSAAFDLGVLSAYGDVEPLRTRHVDLCAAVFEALKELAAAEGIGKRLRHGGLDGLARSNGLGGKSGSGVDAPSLYRAGKVEELLDYCESDVRLTAELYRRASENGTLVIEPTYRDPERNRVELGSRRVPVSLGPTR